MTPLSYKSSLDPHPGMYLATSLNFVRHKMLNSSLTKKWMCQALIIKNFWAFIFMKASLLVAYYQVVFYDNESLDSILHIYVDFTQLQIWQEDIPSTRNSTINSNFCTKGRDGLPQYSYHLLWCECYSYIAPMSCYIKIEPDAMVI